MSNCTQTMSQLALLCSSINVMAPGFVKTRTYWLGKPRIASPNGSGADATGLYPIKTGPFALGPYGFWGAANGFSGAPYGLMGGGAGTGADDVGPNSEYGR